MRTIVYIDGFNLYFRMLQKRPDLKWVNPKLLSEQALRPENQVIQVRYYTARVSARVDPTAPSRQQVYFNALDTVPEVLIHQAHSWPPRNSRVWCIPRNSGRNWRPSCRNRGRPW